MSARLDVGPHSISQHRIGHGVKFSQEAKPCRYIPVNVESPFQLNSDIVNNTEEGSRAKLNSDPCVISDAVLFHSEFAVVYCRIRVSWCNHRSHSVGFFEPRTHYFFPAA